MSDRIEKLAAQHKPEPRPDAYVALSRVVRTQEGSKRFRVPVGTPIQNRPKELKKLEKPTQIDPATGKVKVQGKTGAENHHLFAMRVAELQEALKKLDKNAIKNLLDQLESAKDLPKSANYQKIRDMLKSYLKDKEDDADPKAKK